MDRKTIIFFSLCLSISIVSGQNCQLEGIPLGTRINVDISDISTGVVYTRNTIGIGSVTLGPDAALNGGPYVTAQHSNSILTLSMTENFAQYEEYETAEEMTINLSYLCTNGNNAFVLFIFHVQDTNNNDPIFLPDSEYEFQLAPPLGPGYQITGCNHNIIVRDIDLSTTRIDFTLSGSSDFEILYDENATTEPKQFAAILRTTTFIRSLPEPLELIITATDVDGTDDPRRTTQATVRLTADEAAQIPDEPVFEQALYMATYTEDDTVILEPSISLQQGYHADVTFTLDDDVYRDHFTLNREGNNVTIIVILPLSEDILASQQIYLIVRADRELTSGATTTVVVQLPEEIKLEFQQAHYEGTIDDNELSLDGLILTQGYENRVVGVNVSDDNFSASIDDNIITLLMPPLPENVIEENSFINLQVTAYTGRSSAMAIVTLEIIKNDTVTPVFERALYEGCLDPIHGLEIEQMVLVQGYDNTVDVTLSGEHYTHFGLIRDGNMSTLTVGTLPNDVWLEGNIVLKIEATKPRTVGATAVITITLPEEITLQFEQSHYEGAIIDNILELSDLVLSQGYDEHTVTAIVSHDNFTATVTDNRVVIAMVPSSENVEDNVFINMEVIASTERSSASTVVTLEIIKDDTITPVFEKSLYEGLYNSDEGLIVEQIELIQGYDEDTVNVTLEGEHASLFTLIRNGSISTLAVGTLTSEIFDGQTLMIPILATKPRTVGANSVIAITLPGARQLAFEESSYKGIYQNGSLAVELNNNIVLNVDTGEEVSFSITGDEYATYFEASNSASGIIVSLSEPLPNNIISENNFLFLTLSASVPNAENATTSILIEIIKDDTTTPVFTQTIYHGEYDGVNFVLPDIILSQGFDTTVNFELDGDHARFFTRNYIQDGISLSLNEAIPEDIIFNEKALIFNVLAEKPFTVGAHAAVSITFPSELTELAVMRFTHNVYKGSLENGVLYLDNIILSTGYVPGTEFYLTGEYDTYFTRSETDGIVTILLSTTNTLPENVIADNKFIVLELEARRDRAVSASSVIIIELIQEENPVIIPIFSRAYYRGTYDQDNGLQIEDDIYISDGYDNTVTFNLEGELNEHFSVGDENNPITLSANIPDYVWEDNDQVFLTIIANKSDTISGRAVIAIDFLKEIPNVLLRFQRTSYLGSIESATLNLEPIILTDGFPPDVNFTLHGDLEDYFTLSPLDATVTLLMPSDIPEDSIPANGIIVLEIRAIAEDAFPAFATIVLEVIRDIDVSPRDHELRFNETYYIGSYTDDDEVSLENAITLYRGFDEHVSFHLEGDDSIHFEIVQEPGVNSVTLIAPVPLPPAVVGNNGQLVFIVNAQRENATTVRSTVVILLNTEYSGDTFLGFQRTSYLGSIESATLNLGPIILTDGFTPDVNFTLHGDLEDYFTLSPLDETVTLLMSSAIPEDSIPANGIIVLEIRAIAEDAFPAFATIVLEVIRDIDVSPPDHELRFNETYYIGSYTDDDEVSLENAITLYRGFDEHVSFHLEGDDSIHFEIVQEPGVNLVTLIAPVPLPPAVVGNNGQLVFIVNAQRENATTVRSTVVILLNTEYSGDTFLGFQRTSYLGSIESATLNLGPIILTDGFTPDVNFTLHGDLEDYFTLSPLDETVTLLMSSAIPEDSIPANGIIVLEIRAIAEDAFPAFATIVLEVIRDIDVSPPDHELRFNETYYIGSYTDDDEVSLENAITLYRGFDEHVSFHLEGDDSIHFEIVQEPGVNLVTLIAPVPLPPAVVGNNGQLVFIVNAQRENATTVRSTVVILLNTEYSGDTFLGFQRTSYLGSIESATLNLGPIILTDGFTPDVNFTLHGDLEDYFTLSPLDETVTLLMSSAIPEDSIPANGIIVLEIRAIAEDAFPAFATIVLEVIRDIDVSPPDHELRFNETYYIGSYTDDDEVSLENAITLYRGFDEHVSFHLEGDDSIHFEIVQEPGVNLVTLIAPVPLPPAVVGNNGQLVFIVNAQRENATTVRSTVVILLNTEYSGDTFLGFQRTSYLGSIESATLNLGPIILTDGFTPDVNFTLHGDLEDYFTLSPLDETVTLLMSSAIPEDSIPANGIIVLEIRAIAEDAFPAFATIVLEVIRDIDVSPPDRELRFNETYYIGSYTDDDEVSLENAITLYRGFDEHVSFHLEGDDSIHFEIVQEPGVNSVTLIAPVPLPPAVVGNNGQLVFIVNAQRENATTVRSTVVILLNTEYSGDTFLGFQRTSYLGSIESATLNLGPIILTDGFTPDVNFTLHGDLEDYFTLSPLDETVTLLMPSAIPEDSIPANGIIVLEIRAIAEDAFPAFATIVLEVIRDIDVSPPDHELRFNETYYIGSYTDGDEVSLENAITLYRGFDEHVSFHLEGDDSIHFEIVQEPGVNLVTLIAPVPLPPAVVGNNGQLVFIVNAQRENATTVRSTVVILLNTEYSGDTFLGFQRTSYLGSIESATLNLGPIILTDGFTPDVNFTLHGDLEDYFTLSPLDETVTLLMSSAIPEDSIPANGIIVLEIRAIAEDAFPAFATIVLEVIRDIDVSPPDHELRFNETYYIGSYTDDDEVSLENAITLYRGFDEHVSFHLEGDDSIHFEIVQEPGVNSVTLIAPVPLPPAVVGNNGQLVFIVNAQRENATTVRSTVVILLNTEYSGDTFLGFQRTSYLGSIESATLNLGPIILTDGFTPDVNFTLHGDLEDYFTLSPLDETVTLLMPSAIPEDSIPANGIIVLEIRAIAEDAFPAFATIVLEVIRDIDVSPPDHELRFNETYYIGSYTDGDEVSLENAITLYRGFDEHVSFHLEGDDSIHFEIVQEPGVNLVTLIAPVPLPPAVVGNNGQLVFIVNAQRENATTVRSTVVILLNTEYSGDTFLGFQRTSYLGSIESATLNLGPIILTDGFTPDVNFTLHGDLEDYFTLSPLDETVTLLMSSAIPEDSIPANGIIVLEIRAIAEDAFPAFATIVLEVIRDIDVSPPDHELRFNETYYIGSYTDDDEVSLENAITLYRGFDEHVSFHLEGDDSIHFEIVQEPGVNSVTLIAPVPLPPAVVGNNGQLVFIVNAQRENATTVRSTVVILLNTEYSGDTFLGFQRTSYLGSIESATLNLEPIILTDGFTPDVNFTLHGDLEDYFTLSPLDETVTLLMPSAIPEDSIPANGIIVLEIRAIAEDAFPAFATIILDVIFKDPQSPTVSFNPLVYVLRAQVFQTGIIDRVSASADNGEAITYSVIIEDDHLRARLTVTEDGELYLSFPVNSGEYIFEVVATSQPSQGRGTAAVHLTVESINVALPPLIVLDRDEEVTHENLVVLDNTQYSDCTYSITNSWPINQNWLYVDANGLHTRAIDREDPSIAYMALSQVQVELVLHCNSDTRIRRSLDEESRLEWLGPYDYGTNRWIIADSISYNSTRTFVNLIVNDINDNYPIFAGKENEPIVVGYPVADLEQVVMPRALAELQATDADIGENAVLLYWSSDSELAVSPSTGSVHVLHENLLQNDQTFTVSATDRNGEGLTGTITIMVKLLDTSNIAVITVGDAFIEDEQYIIANLSRAVGYDVKVLRSVVISSQLENEATEAPVTEAPESESRKKREVTSTPGAMLELYVYGLVQREPVAVERLAEDINNNVVAEVNLVNAVTLEHHLELRIVRISENNIGFMVATIVLSVLLFALIVAIGVWFFIKWRKERSFAQFDDESSLESRNNSIGEEPKEDRPMPRMNLEDLKKSERRLQEMIDGPYKEVVVEPKVSEKENIAAPLKDISQPDSSASAIVIQDKLKDAEEDLSDVDEFGEIQTPRRKSVVTFNENVEKIIHVQEQDTNDDMEIFRL